MPEVSQLTRSKPTETVIDLGDGDTVTIVFDRNKVTPNWVDEAQKRDEEQDTLSLPKALADVIVSWDVTNEGEPFPPTPENLAVFSYPAQSELLKQILVAAVPSRAEGNASGSTSSTDGMGSTSEPATPPNGHTRSPSPEPLVSPYQT